MQRARETPPEPSDTGRENTPIPSLPPSRGKDTSAAADGSAAPSPPPLGVYVHWPYCARVCPYCDFNVVRDRGRSAAGERLVQAIAADLAAQAALAGPAALVSIYFGGGTPSLMRPEHVARLIEEAGRFWRPAGPVEVTLEANPNDVTPERLGALVEAGVNRLSLGVQALDDAALRFLGRDHDAARARAALDTALALPLRVSLDLIYALPGQSVADWRETLSAAARLGADHLSAYQLTLEPGTALARAAARGLFEPAGEEVAADLYEATLDVLSAAGFEPYEISNFSRGVGARSRHNLVYWRGEAYAGVGPGAHGRLPLAAGRTATQAERRVEDYIARVAAEGVGWASGETLSGPQVLEERVYMGLRSAEGVERADIAALNRIPALERLLAEGWLEPRGGRVVCAPCGRLVLDSLTGALLA